MNIDLSGLELLSSDDDRCEIEVPDYGTFSVDRHGIVRDHGKFYGEDVLVPYFWSLACQGFADAETYGWVNHYFFSLEEGEDDQAIDRLGQEFVLWETDDGFVRFSSNPTSLPFDEWVRSIEYEHME